MIAEFISPETLGFILIAVMLFAIFIGFPISFTLIFLGFVFGYLGFGKLVFYLMTLQFSMVMTEQTLAAVPLFVFMGIMMEQAGLMERLFSAFQLTLAKVRGSLYYAVLFVSVVFAAANASTDVIKDMMYGRPIKKNDLLADNALKLLGINRYLAYKAKREGVGKALLETMLPPMTVFDRGGKDLDDLLSGKEYKGNLLQGSPLDIVYWRYLGGLDKINNSN